MPKRNSIPHSRLEISIPVNLRLEAELFLRRDPLSGKIAFGEWSNYVSRLINQDLKDRARKGN